MMRDRIIENKLKHHIVNNYQNFQLLHYDT